MEPNTEEQVARTAGDDREAARSVGRTEWIPMGIILAAAAAVRFIFIGSPSLSMDEVSELRIAHAGLGDVVSIGDGFPPLYHLILHAIVWAGDLAARYLSACFGLATVAVVWLWARRAFGSQLAYWVAGLISLSPLAVHLSREGRAYSLFLFLASVSVWALWRALDDPTRSSWIIWGAVCAAGMYTHYMFTVVIVAGLAVAVAVEASVGLAGGAGRHRHTRHPDRTDPGHHRPRSRRPIHHTEQGSHRSFGTCCTWGTPS